MATFRTILLIPALTIAVTVAGCSSDGQSDPPVVTSDSTDVDASTASTPATLEPGSTPTTKDTISSTPTAITVSVEVGVDSSPTRVEQVPLGASVILTIVDNSGPNEYHLHGFELGDGMEMAKGEAETFRFTADKAGEFEVESHANETVLVVLKVG